MNKISEDKIAKFKKIYKEQFGRDIAKEEAIQRLEIIVRSMRLIYRPMTKKEFEIINKRRKELNLK